jgi:hypothetical protein
VRALEHLALAPARPGLSVVEMLSALSPRVRNALAALVIAGGAGGLRALRDVLRDAVREQQRIVASAGGGETAAGGKPRAAAPKVAVDAVFAGRLANILKVCVPSPFCAEAGLIYAQTVLLVARTLLTVSSAASLSFQWKEETASQPTNQPLTDNYRHENCRTGPRASRAASGASSSRATARA